MRRNDSSSVRTDEEHPGRSPKKTKTSRSTRLGDYEIHTSAQGFSSVRQVSAGEVMHSVNAPSDEADKLYVKQSFLSSRLTKREDPGRRTGDLGRGTRCSLKCHGRHSLFWKELMQKKMPTVFVLCAL